MGNCYGTEIGSSRWGLCMAPMITHQLPQKAIYYKNDCFFNYRFKFITMQILFIINFVLH